MHNFGWVRFFSNRPLGSKMVGQFLISYRFFNVVVVFPWKILNYTFLTQTQNSLHCLFPYRRLLSSQSPHTHNTLQQFGLMLWDNIYYTVCCCAGSQRLARGRCTTKIRVGHFYTNGVEEGFKIGRNLLRDPKILFHDSDCVL